MTLIQSLDLGVKCTQAVKFRGHQVQKIPITLYIVVSHLPWGSVVTVAGGRRNGGLQARGPKQRIPFPDKPDHKANILLINCTGGPRQYVFLAVPPTAPAAPIAYVAPLTPAAYVAPITPAAAVSLETPTPNVPLTAPVPPTAPVFPMSCTTAPTANL